MVDVNDGDAFGVYVLPPIGDAIVLCKLVSILLFGKFIFNSIAWFLPLYCPAVDAYKRLLFFGSCLIMMLLAASIICSW